MSMEVVVVLPCVPATAITRRPAMTEASAAARCRTRIPRRVASASSGLSARMALDTTSVSPGPRRPRLPAACPMCTLAPSACSSSSSAESFASLPDTVMPRASMIRAMPDMPAPPMPVKCTRPSRAAGTGSAAVIEALSIGAFPFTISTTASASQRSASPRPSEAAASDMSATWSMLTSTGSRVSRIHSGVRSASVTSMPPPRCTIGSAFSRCSPLPMGSGT